MNFLLISDINNRREKNSVLTESGSSEKLLRINNEEVKSWTPYLLWEVQCTLESFLNDTEEIEIVESFYSPTRGLRKWLFLQWLTPSSLRSLSSTVPLQFGNECSALHMISVSHWEYAGGWRRRYWSPPWKRKMQCLLHNCDQGHFIVEWHLCNEVQKWPRVMAWPLSSHFHKSLEQWSNILSMNSLLWCPEEQGLGYLKEWHPVQPGQAFDVHIVYDTFIHRGSPSEKSGILEHQELLLCTKHPSVPKSLFPLPKSIWPKGISETELVSIHQPEKDQLPTRAQATSGKCTESKVAPGLLSLWKDPVLGFSETGTGLSYLALGIHTVDVYTRVCHSLWNIGSGKKKTFARFFIWQF